MWGGRRWPTMRNWSSKTASVAASSALTWTYLIAMFSSGLRLVYRFIMVITEKKKTLALKKSRIHTIFHVPNERGLRSSDNSVIGAFIHWPLSVIARMCGACAFRIVSMAIVLSALFTPQIGSSCGRKDTWSLDFSLISKRQHDRNFPLRIFGSAAAASSVL